MFVLTSLALEQLFPNGILPYLLGGFLVGLGTAVIYLGTGIAAGASQFLETSLSYVSSLEPLNRPDYVASRDWRVVFTLGIVAGAAGYTLATGEFGWTTAVAPWRLLVGGILVGIGTRVGKGCTSGHGICGVGSRSRTSIGSVLTFIVVAIGTAQIVQALGVIP